MALTNDLHPVVFDLTETEYAKVDFQKSRSEGAGSPTPTSVQSILNSSIFCGCNDTSNDTRQDYTAKDLHRMATSDLGSHRKQGHLSMARSQSASPYHQYYRQKARNQKVPPDTVRGPIFRRLNDHYVLTGQIVKCKVSTLWEALDRKTDRLICIKDIDKRRFTTKSDRETAMREISIYRSLGRNSPIRSIPQCYECFEDKDHWYIVLDYEAGGENLGTMLRDSGPLPEKKMQWLASMLLQSLSQLHSKFICHNDLRVENVLFPGAHKLFRVASKLETHHSKNRIDYVESCVKFCDLGRALCVSHQQNENDPAGRSTSKDQIRHSSLYYMAPEVLCGKSPGLASDIWSVGVILYLLFSGHMPFECDPQQSSQVKREHLKRQIRQADYSFASTRWSKVSRSAKQFVSSLLHQDPVVRMTCEEAMLHPWLANIRCVPSKKNPRMAGRVPEYDMVGSIDRSILSVGPTRSISNNVSFGSPGKPPKPSLQELPPHPLMSDGSVSTTEGVSAAASTTSSRHRKSKSLVHRLWGKIKIKHRSTKSENDLSTTASTSTVSAVAAIQSGAKGPMAAASVQPRQQTRYDSTVR